MLGDQHELWFFTPVLYSPFGGGAGRVSSQFPVSSIQGNTGYLLNARYQYSGSRPERDIARSQPGLKLNQTTGRPFSKPDDNFTEVSCRGCGSVFFLFGWHPFDNNSVTFVQVKIFSSRKCILYITEEKRYHNLELVHKLGMSFYMNEFP